MRKQQFYKPVSVREREARFISQTSRTSPSLWLRRSARCEAIVWANIRTRRSLRSLACARELRSLSDLRLATAFPQSSLAFAHSENLKKINRKIAQISFKILPNSFQTLPKPSQIHPEPSLKPPLEGSWDGVAKCPRNSFIFVSFWAPPGLQIRPKPSQNRP